MESPTSLRRYYPPVGLVQPNDAQSTIVQFHVTPYLNGTGVWPGYVPEHTVDGYYPSSWPTQANATQSSSTSKLPPCIRCWSVRRKCSRTDEFSSCSRCSSLPRELCDSNRVSQHKPFEKWLNQEYENLFTKVNFFSGDLVEAKFQHFMGGPVLQVTCSLFTPSCLRQCCVRRQDESGWHQFETTPYCLLDPDVKIAGYIERCVYPVWKSACLRAEPMAVIFRVASMYAKVPIVRQCMKLYTALCVMRSVWQFASDETLGMTAVEQPGSAWHGFTPIPRMIQNQLGHAMEKQMVELDQEILKSVDKMIRDKKLTRWPILFVTMAIILHTRELDIGRNIHWSRHGDPDKFWIHPSKPKELIEEAVMSCRSLLSHFYFARGQLPLTTNLATEASKKKADHDNTTIRAITILQGFRRWAKKRNLIGRSVREKYRDGDPDSLSFTVSSLLFAEGDSVWDVKDVC